VQGTGHSGSEAPPTRDNFEYQPGLHVPNTVPCHGASGRWLKDTKSWHINWPGNHSALQQLELTSATVQLELRAQAFQVNGHGHGGVFATLEVYNSGLGVFTTRGNYAVTRF
jgi:hypothetical protein